MNYSRISTVFGFIAILFWSTSIAFFRSVAEKAGPLDMAFFTLFFGSLFLFILLWFLFRKRLFTQIKALPLSYYLKVGSFLIIYESLLYMAVGYAASRESVIVVGIINYLWPGLTFLFSVPILGKKAKYSMLTFGIIVAFAGTVIAVILGNNLSTGQLTESLARNFPVYLLALGGAVTWGIYSNMTRKYHIEEDIAAMPVLFLLSSVVILFILITKGQVPRLLLSGTDYLEFGYVVIFPSALAYLFWDRAMKKGDKDLISAFSYGIPLVSTLISCYYLGVVIGAGMIIAAVLVIAGAVLCRYSIH